MLLSIRKNIYLFGSIWLSLFPSEFSGQAFIFHCVSYETLHIYSSSFLLTLTACSVYQSKESFRFLLVIFVPFSLCCLLSPKSLITVSSLILSALWFNYIIFIPVQSSMLCTLHVCLTFLFLSQV